MKNKFFVFVPIVMFAGMAAQHDAALNEIISRADLNFSSREVTSSLEASVTLYKEAIETDLFAYDAYWKLARAYYWIGEHAKEDKLKLFEKGRDTAKDAITAKLDGIDGHFYYGMLIGKVGEEKGILNSLSSVDPIKKEMERCLELDPKYSDAYLVLSVLYRKAPGWPLSIGDKNKSKEYGLKAIELYPQRVRYHLELGRTYAELGDYKNARASLQEAIDMPLEVNYVPDGKEDKEAAKKLLEEIKNR